MTLPARCLLVSVLTLANACWAQMLVVPDVEPPAEVIRRAIPVEDPSEIAGASPEVEALPRVLPEVFKVSYSRCEVPGQVIALTFDDGPHATLTPRLLDILRQRNIKATFFLVGRNVAAYPQIVRRIAEEGHEVANHSWSHPVLTSLGNEGVESQLRRTHDAIVAACGKAPLLYRPPYGQIRIAQRKRIFDTFHYPAIIWDVDPQDWQSPRTSQKVHDRVLKMTRPGSIILCHDIHATTVDAMPALLDEMKLRGFQFATVTQLIQLEAQSKAALVPATATVPEPAPGATVPSPVVPAANESSLVPLDPVPASPPVKETRP